MAKKTTTTLEFKGLFDVSDIIAKAEQIKKTMENNKANQQDIFGISEALKEMKQLSTEIESLSKKGYSSELDITEMSKMYKAMYSWGQKIDEITKDIHFPEIDNQISSFRTSIQKINTILDTTKKNLLNTLKIDLSGVMGINKGIDKSIGLLADTFLNNAKSGKTYADTLEEVNSQLAQMQDNVAKSYDKEVFPAKNQLENMKKELDKNYGEIFKTHFLSKNMFSDFKDNEISQDTYRQFIEKYQDIIRKSTDRNVNTNRLMSPKKILETVQGQIDQLMDNLGIMVKPDNENLMEYRLHNILNEKKVRGMFSTESTGIKQVEAEIDEIEGKYSKAELTIQDFLKTLKEEDDVIKKYFNTYVEQCNEVIKTQEKLNKVEKEQKEKFLGVDNFSESLSEMKDYNKEMSREWRDNLRTTELVDTTFSKITNAFDTYFSATYIIRNLIGVVKQTFNDVEKIDKAFGSIAMVTNKTVADLWQSYGDYQEMANKLGQSTESAIKASALYYQQGNLTSNISGLRSEKIIDFI